MNKLTTNSSFCSISLALHSKRLQWLLAAVICSLLATGCGTPSGGGGQTVGSDPSIDPGVEPNTPAQGGGDQAVTVVQTVDQDLDKAVDKIKDRDTNLPQRGVFFSVGIRNLERVGREEEGIAGNDSDITNLSFGYDQIIGESWILGALVDLSKREQSSNAESESLSGGSVSSDTGTLFLFASADLNSSYSLTGYVGLGKTDSSTSRTVSDGVFNPGVVTVDPLVTVAGEVSGNSENNIVLAGISIQRQFFAGTGNRFFLRADADFSSIDTDAFTETGSTNTEIAFDKHTQEKRLFTLGAGYSRTFSSSVGVVVPTFTVSFLRDDPDDEAITATVVARPDITDDIELPPTDESYGKFDFDIVLVRPRGFQYFANAFSYFANDFEESAGLSLGARLEF